MNDYRIEIKVKNANILRLMKIHGIESIAELCRRAKVSQSIVGSILNLKETPLRKDGKWRPTIISISKVLNIPPEILFSEEQLKPLARNTGYKDVGFDEILQLTDNEAYGDDPSLLLEDKDMVRVLSQAMSTLEPREQEVLTLRFGLEGETYTLEQIAKKMEVCRERIHQIEAKALRKMRHPHKSNSLREFTQEN